MKRVMSLVLCGILSLALPLRTAASLIYWSGALPTGWRGGVTPAATDDVYLGNAVNRTITLSGDTTLNTVTLASGGDTYTIDAPLQVKLTLTGGLLAADTDFDRLVLQPHILMNVTGTQAFDAGSNTIVLFNKLTGTGSPILLGNGTGAFLFVNIAGGNDYTGNTTIGNGSTFPTIAFWNGSPFGTGTVTFLNGGNLIAHNNAPVIANNLVFNSVASTNSLGFKSWDDVLTISGGITLANNTSISANAANTALAVPDGSGSFPLPGPLKRYPTVISGAISGAHSLTMNGQGIFLLTGTNSYSGGTTVSGNVIFGNNGAIPATGTITVNSQGYAGIGDLTPGNFATQIASHFSLTGSTGAIGVDTLPGNSTVTFSDPIDLTGFSSSNIRIGTATSAILTGTITPQGSATSNYQFGNGGGSLYVQSALTGTRGVSLNNTGPVPLKLYLQGANTYSNGTVVTSFITSGGSGGFLIFDGANALPSMAANSLTAGGAGGLVGNTYLGYTDAAGVNGGSLLGPNPAGFLGLFNKASTWGIIGFDTHAGNSTVNISGPIDLTGFNDGVYLGTATSAILSGPITPSTVINTYNAANTLRFTAVNGGTLTVNSALADGGSALALSLGAPNNNNNFSDGTVILNGANTYTGGTTINPGGMGITVVAGSSNAFGTGTINVAGGASFGLQVAPAVVINNPINFVSGGALYLTGTKDITLNGNLTGSGSVNLYNASPINATLAGDNAAFTGDIAVTNGQLNLANNNAAGTGTVYLKSPDASVYFPSAAPSPVLHGLSGDTGSLFLANGNDTVLTFQMDDDLHHDGSFGGVISAPGGAVTDASIVVTAANNSDNGTVYLYGHNLYSGGTTISGYGTLGLGQPDSAGSGAITLNATEGGLILNSGVTLTNSLILNTGGLAGLGAYNPVSVNGDSSPGRTITFGANMILYPGIPGGNLDVPGILTFNTNVAFANGGNLREMIQDPTLANTVTGSLSTNVNGGYSLVYVTGNLDLSLLGASQFVISVESVNFLNQKGYSSLIAYGQAYVITIIQTTGSITGFNANQFVFDLSNFQNGDLNSSLFSVTADSTHLYLNFTAVPEPSTWALLATGTAFLGLAAWRRRRA